MTRPRILLVAAAALAAILWTQACGDGGTEPPPTPPPDPPRPTSVTVTPATVEFTAIGATAQLAAEVRDQNGRVMAGAAVSWSSGDVSVVTVTSSGLVTAVANGTATITARAGQASGPASVTIAQVVSAVTVTPTANTLVVADTLRLSADAADANGHPVTDAEFTWASSDTMVAVVDDAGLVTAIGAGQAEIRAISSGVAGSAAITVEVLVPTTVEVTPDTVAFTALGQTAQLAAEVRDQNRRVMAGVAVSWSSSDTTVAMVDSAGIVTAAGPGSTTITAAAGDAAGTAVASVIQSADSVVVTPARDTISVGDTLRLAALAYDENGHPVDDAVFTWLSSDPSVATVDASGLVRGVAAGAATISATAGDAHATAEITVTNPDRAALVALYNATDGPNWVNNENWLTDAPLGDWYGVETDASGRVVRLDLAGVWDADASRYIRNGLDGSIPAEIGSLSRLTSLSLSRNNLTGPIPPEIGNLASLTWLELANNALSGPVPNAIGNLSDLTWLELSENKLSGPIPPDIGNLANLRRLSLGANLLTDAIPPEIGDLTSIGDLLLAGNYLTGPIPPEIGNLARLSFLALSHNNLTGPIPPEIGNLATLEILTLRNNSLTGGVPRELGNLVSLKSLYLEGNDLTELQPGVFVGLASLTHLDLRDNPGAPFTLNVELLRTDNESLLTPGPARVTVRVAEGTPFAMRIPLSAVGGDLSLDTLTIGTGGARSEEVTVTRNAEGTAGTRVAVSAAPVVPDDIRGIEIEVADPIILFQSTAPTVSFTTPSESAPEGGTAMLEISLSEPATAAVTFTYMVGVDEDPATADADASDHSLDAAGSIEIAAGASSADIEVAINDDDDLEPVREVLTVTLDTPGTESGYARGFPHFATVTIEEGVCDRTPQVARGIVRALGAADCSQPDARGLAGIDRLNLGPGGLQTGGEQYEAEFHSRPCAAVAPNAPDPRQFDWGPGACSRANERDSAVRRSGRARDAITELRRGDFSGLTSLTHLDLAGNSIRELPDSVFAGLSALFDLTLQGNPLTELEPDDFAGLSRLWSLNLRSTALTRLPAGAFSQLANLSRLFLHDGRLAELAPGAFAGLQDLELLWLNNNQLAELPPDIFAGLGRLRELWIWWNQLTELPPNLFADLSGLTHLFVNQNRLTGLPDGVFSGLTRLTHLGVHENRIAALQPELFSDLANLYELGLHGNELSRLPAGVFADLRELERLALSSNQFAEWPGTALTGLPGLRQLYLSQNRFSALPAGAFRELSGLELLDLRVNRLSELPAGVFLGLSRLRSVSLGGNPGAPFTLTLNARRTDSDDPLAPGPATVEVALAEGAPLAMSIPLSVHGGEASANAVSLEAGSDHSSAVRVTRATGNQAGTQVVAGPAPALPSTISGIRLSLADPLVLFATASNRAPVAEQTAPWLRLRVGGASGSVDASSYFRDPDGDDLTYAASSDNPDVVTAEASGDRVTVVPAGAGSATVTMTATDPDGLTARSSFPVGVRGASPGSYDIDLLLIDEVSPSIQAAFDDAVEYWSSILADNELPDVSLAGDFDLGCAWLTTRQTLPTIDELVIVAAVSEIDGALGILARAAPCGVREDGGLPFMGAMEFDIDDLERLEEAGDMEEVILHEMGHVLGIGTIWDEFGLLKNPSLPDNPGADTHFAGPLTVEAFDEAGGAAYSGGKVPVENRAGPGSGDSHWRESVLDHELMTPIQNGGVADPLSAITILSLADLGYKVDVSIAEPYRLPGTAGAADRLPGRRIEYGDDILRTPIIVVDRQGRVVRVIPN